MKVTLLAAYVCLFTASSAFNASAFLPPEQPTPTNYDRRVDHGSGTSAAQRSQAAAQLRTALPGTRVDLDAITLAPAFVRAQDTVLEKAVASALASAPDPYTITRTFISRYTNLFGHGPEALDKATLKSKFTTPHNGLETLIWQQQVDGIPVFEAQLVSHTTKQGDLVNISSHFVPDPDGAATRGVQNRAQLAGTPVVSAAQALAAAARDLGQDPAENATESAGPPTGPEKSAKFQGSFIRGEAETKLTWLPMDDQALRLCWDLVVTPRNRAEMFRLLVDAETGEVLVRRCLTAYLSDVSYRVFTNDSPSPMSPGFPTPVSTQPPLVSRTLMTLPALDTNASPSGWIDDGGNETRGNNVDAHTDRNNDDLPDLPRPQGSPSRVFDFPMDLTTQEPTNYSQAAVVQLFYFCNWMHDKLYQLGFTEAAGNFQSNNFGRGGIGNDAVAADAQDGGGFNNANFSTPPDGSPGRMQMYLFNGPTPDRDGDFDGEVVLHEYTHGLSNRRVGGGVGISALQSQGMGEGWSDFYGLSLLSEPTDDFNGVYAAGAYVTYQLSGLTTNYYFGIRRYPYCTDMNKNPLTFKDIDPNQASVHPGIPRSPIIGSTANEVHNQGEVWCVTLWDARVNLIAKYGYAVGNQLILQLVTDGMNLSPANPTFLQARDAILQADVVDKGGADLPQLWAAFAKRGMGSGASSPASSTTIGVVESFIVPDSLNVSPSTGFTSSGPVGGPFSPASLNFTLINTGTNPVNWAASQAAAWMNLSQSNGTIAVGTSNLVTATLNSTVYTLTAAIYTNIVRFTNVTTGVVQSRNFVLRVGQPDYYTELFDAGDNDLDNQTLTFTPDGSTNYYSVCREVAFAFPTDPASGTNVPLGAHTFLQFVTPTNISIYGRSTNVLFLASEGHLTLIAGDSSGSVTLANHFSRPRVSASLAHIHPTENGGRVVWQQLSNRVVISFIKVVEYSTANTNSFQMELFYDGRIRMTHLFLGTTSGLVGLSAGNGIPTSFVESDLSSYGPCALPMVLTVPHSATEGDPPVLGQINIFSAATTNVTFSLSSLDTSEATVPATATVLAGQTSTNFPITIVNDVLLDGPQPATITATAPGYLQGLDTIVVGDNETATLSLTLPASTTEGVGSVQGTVRSSAAPANNIAVSLSSSDTTELQVPPSVVLPAGQTSVVFTATIIDDTLIDGDQSAIITAHVPNWTDAQATVVVHDNESTNLVVTLPVAAREGNGTLINAGTVAISGTLPTNLSISLGSSDTTELTVPATATIIAGQTSTTFNLTVIDDPIIDGPQTVVVTAIGFGFSNGVASMIINDDESPPIPTGPTPADQATNVIQTTGLSWVSGAVPGESITNDVYFGTSPTPGPAQLQGTTTGTNWTLANLLPLTKYYWQVVARKAGVVPGPVWQFTTRGLDHFAWDPIGSPKYVSQPFPVVLTAKDLFGVTVSNYLGTAALSGVAGGAVSASSPMLVIQTGASISGSVRTVLNNLGKAHDFVSTEDFTTLNLSNYNTIILGMDGGSVSYASMAALAARINSGARLIILGGSALSTYAMGVNDFFIGVNTNNYSWTTVAGTPHFTVTSPGHVLAAGLPAFYNYSTLSASYYMARVTDGGVSSVANNGDGFKSLLTKPVGQGSVVMFTSSVSDGYWGVPADFAILTTVISNALVLTGGTPVPITPVTSGSFVNGVWSGNVSVLAPTTNLVLRADDGGGHSGVSTNFAVQLQNDISVTITDSPDPVSVGGNLNYNIVVTNIGPAAATGVVVTNVLPPTAPFASAVLSQGTFTTNGSVVACSLGSLPGNSSATVTIHATPTVAGTISNSVAVYRGEADAYASNNTAAAVTVVQTPTISINDVTLYEGNSGFTNAVFTVTVSPPPALPVSMNFATANGSALVPGDYISTNGVLNFAIGETNKTIRVAVVGDTLYELDETFNLNLSSPSNASFADSVGIATILNDDPIPTLSIGDVTVVEGNTGTTNAVFPITLSAASGADVTASYATADGNATSASDYIAASGGITIPAGSTNTSISIAVRGDLSIESDEVFYVDLFSVANATLLKREGYALILNDDGLPGQLDHFVWSNPGPTQYLGAPFGVTITAQDAFNNAATAFSGTALLTATASGGATSNNILDDAAPTSSSSGSFTLGYSFTPNATLTVTQVRSFFGTKVSIWSDTGTLLATQPVSGPPGVWTATPLDTPLTLSAGTTYRIAAYSGAGSYYWRTDLGNTFSNGVINIGYESSGDAFPTLNDGVTWWFVDMVYTVGAPTSLPITPASSGTFVSGVWSGNMTALAVGTNVILRANDGNGHTGVTIPFTVDLRNDLSLQLVDAPDPVSVGADLTYSLVVTNTGPASATGVLVTNLLPVTATLVSAGGSQGWTTLNGSTVIFGLGTIPAGAAASASIVVRPTAAGSITNTATAYRSEPDAFLGNNSAVAVTVVQQPTLSVNNVSVAEGNAGFTSAVFTVSLSLPAGTNVTVRYATADGSASATSDYVAASGTILFTPGQTSHLVAIQVIGDANIEANETFSLNLSNPTNAVLGIASGTATILNDDIPPNPTNVLAQGNLRLSLNLSSAGLNSVTFMGNEIYTLGTYISDWGLQTGTNSATFLWNGNGGAVLIPMSWTAGDSRSASFLGTYTSGGANVAVTRDYAFLLGVDAWRSTMTFRNNGISSITLRCFETYDVDWQYFGTSYYTTANDRYTIATNSSAIQIGRSLMTNGPLVVLVGTTDPGSIIAACSSAYFGITTSSALNTFFASNGADSNGALQDDTLDIGREYIIAPGATASFTAYQSISTNIPTAEFALVGNLAKAPLRFSGTSLGNGYLQFFASASDNAPITPERASHIQLYYCTNLVSGSWVRTSPQTVLNNGTLQVLVLDYTNSPIRFYRAIETP